jgi:hypothetical protein
VYRTDPLTRAMTDRMALLERHFSLAGDSDTIALVACHRAIFERESA